MLLDILNIPFLFLCSLGPRAIQPAIVIATLGLLLLLWRLWTFTIAPLLFPQRPREMPYWIPILGHALAFFKDSSRLVTDGREMFQNSREPFAITVAGQKLYILTSSDDVAAAYRNVTTLSWEAYLNDLLIAFGLNSSALVKVWQKPTIKTSASYADPINPLQKCLILVTEDLYKRQLLPGEKLDILGARFISHVDEHLQWEKLRGRYVLSSTAQLKRVSLFKFCEQFLVKAITRTMFGDLIYDLEPDLTQYLLDFNDDVWMLIFHYPQFAAKRLCRAQKKILNTLECYIKYPKESRVGESWLIESVIAQQVVAEIDDQNRAKMLLMIYWAAVSNAYKMAFWVVAYIVTDVSLLKAVQTETNRLFANGTLDTPNLLKNCPVLDSVYNEVLRLVNGAISARKIIAPTEIGGKTLSKGNSILIPYRQLHFNPDVFGQDADYFNPGRFLNNKGLAHSPSFRPYGGGATYCPGRVLAAQEIYSFVAFLLHRFQVELAPNESSIFPPFPQLEDSVPALGITGPMKGMDVCVTLRKSLS